MSVPPGFLESLHDSPAIAYVKDLDGRYLYVNRRYGEFFGVDESEIRGRIDGELPQGATIDGSRNESGNTDGGEPLQLEYTVGPVDGRPALAVWRFAVRGPDGDAVAVCAVAAPVAEAAVARSECERLVSASDAEAPAELPTEDDRIATLHQASARAARRAHELLSELTSEREQRLIAEQRFRAAEGRVSELEAALPAVEGQPEPDDELVQKLAEADRRTAAVEAAAQELGDQLVAERERLSEAEASLDAARAELAAERSRAEAAEAAAEGGSELADRLADADQRAAAAEAAAQELGNQLVAERQRADQAARDLHGRLATERVQLAEAKAELDAARAELAAERNRADAAEAAAEDGSELAHRLAEADQRAAQAEAAAAAERQRADVTEAAAASERQTAAAAEAVARELADQLESERRALGDGVERLSASEVRIADLEGQLTGARADREALLAEWTALEDTPTETEPEAEPETSELRWSTSAGRALTLALAQSDDWREGVKAAIGVLGVEGGWDAICAWQPDDRQPFAACFAMWTGDEHGLSAFETATWQRRQPLAGSTIGQAFTWADSRWLSADADAPEHRLKLLAQYGMRGALIVAVRDGARTLAALELLTSSPAPPSTELTEAIDAIALQLGHFGHLVSAAAQPRWRVGRV